MNQDVNPEPFVFSSGGIVQNESDAKDPSKDPFWKRHAGVVAVIGVMVTAIGVVVTVIGLNVTLIGDLKVSMDAGFDRITDSLNSFRADMSTEFANLRAEIGSVRAEIGSVRSENGSVRAEFGNEIRSVRDEIKGLRQDHQALGQVVGRLEGKLAKSGQHEASDPNTADNTN